MNKIDIVLCKRIDGKFIRYCNTAPIYQSINNKLKLIHHAYEIHCIPIDMKYIVEDVNKNDDTALITAIFEQMISDSILDKMHQKHIPIGGSNIYVD